MELPFPYFRVRGRLDMFAIPSEEVSYLSMRSGLTQLGRKYPDTFGKFLPQTWYWNSRTKLQSEEESVKEKEEFWALVQSSGASERFVVKLEGSSRARGVHIFRGGEKPQGRLASTINYSGCVGQRYLENVCLLPSKRDPTLAFKWDLRLYLLMVLDECGNLSAFQYCDAFARRCSKPYSLEVNDREGHITNTAVNNKFGDEELCEYAKQLLEQMKTISELDALKLPTPVGDIDDYEEIEQTRRQRSAKEIEDAKMEMPVTMTLDAAWERLISTGAYSAEQVEQGKRRMDELVASLFGAVNANRASGEHSQKKKSALEYSKHVLLLGLDILFDKDLNPFLLEINRSPDFRCYSMDQLRIKQELIYHTLRCVFPSANLDLVFSPCQASELDDMWVALNSRSAVPMSASSPPCESDTVSAVETLAADIKWTQVCPIIPGSTS